MKLISATILCGMILTPTLAHADPKLSGEAILGYGNSTGENQSFGIFSLTLSDKYEFESGMGLKWDLRGRIRTDEETIGNLDDEKLDGSVEVDFGAGGKLGFSTYNDDFDQYPWADGELYDRGSLGVFPVIRKRYDSVADSVFVSPTNKVDPDLLVTYSNKIGPVKLDLVGNPLGTWDGYKKSELMDVPVMIEGKLTLPTDFGIYSITYNDLDDAEIQAIFPIRSAGVTLIARHSINEADWGDSRSNLAVIYRAKDMGYFKGAMLAHARDSNASRSLLNLNFGGDKWKLKVAGDTDGDFAAEASYAINDKATLMLGWDNGHDIMEGFNDAVFPAPVFAPARGNAFEVALKYTF